ncbi:MAG: phytanoyl-CoA dioxygenase family protein [Verrucomicrobia bacterium]|nr:phytanoyl-CoA dioxygenase family protein [Verrucomicrobiota bacterium]
MCAKLDHDALRERYEADGFVVVRGLFPAAEFQELQDQLARYVREVVPTLPKDAAFFDDYSKPETLRKMQSLNRHDPWFDRFLQRGSHVPLLEHFMRDKCSPQGLEWFDKLPYDTNATPAHQDGFYWCRKPNIACGLWIALDRVDRENGCLWYARGSHRLGILPHAPSGVLGFSQGLLNFDPKAVDGVPIELEPGDAVAHSSATIHWTDVNRTARHRRAIATFCFGASTVRDEEAFARYKASLKSQLEKRGIAVTS